MRNNLDFMGKIGLLLLCLCVVLAAILAVGCFGEKTEAVEPYWGEYQGGGNSTIIIERDKVVLKGKEYSYTKNGNYIRLNDLTQGTYRLFGDDILCLTSVLLVDVENTRYFDLGSFPTRSGYFEQTLTKLDNRYNAEYVYMFEANGTYTVAADDIRLAHHGSYTLVDGVLILTGQDYLTGAAVNEMSYISADMWFYPVAYVKNRARYTNPRPTTGDDGHIHTPVQMPDELAPTCTTQGLSGGVVCSECFEVLQQGVAIPALGHNYKSVVTAPTCTELGYTTYTCSRCGDSFVTDVTETPHPWGEWIVAQDATCTASGLRYHVCTLCGTTGREILPALGHAGEWVVDSPASCATGIEHRVCSRCDLYEVRQVAPIRQHEYGADGICRRCDEHEPTAGFVYTYRYETAYLMGYTGTDTIIYIPSSSAGLPVSIGYDAFKDRSELTSITISYGVTHIDVSAFEGCTGLTSITLPDSVAKIDGFSDCTGLSSIVIPGVILITPGAFAGCSGLTYITIGNRVTQIGYSAFARCRSLSDIYYDGTMAQWAAITKGDHWDYETGNYVVHCLDGDIQKN